MERTPEEGMDVTYSCTFRFHSPYLLLGEREGDSGQNVNKVNRGPQVGRERRAETSEIPWSSFSGLAFKMGMNSEGRANKGTQGC